LILTDQRLIFTDETQFCADQDLIQTDSSLICGDCTLITIQ
jgi:hypothetical protein